MAIHEYYKKATRRKIAFYEEKPPKEATAYLSGYEFCRFDKSDFVDPTKLADVAAVIFRQRSLQPNKIAQDLRQFAETLLWYDCRVFVEVVSVEPGSKAPLFRSIVIGAIEKGQLPASFGSAENGQILSPVVRIFDHNEVWSKVVAEDLRNYPPDVSLSLELEIEGFNGDNQPIQKACEKRILIQRAFHDCLKVKLVRCSDGLSGIDTYRVYATHRYDMVGDTPFEYFVKIGDRNQVSKEYLAYRDIALEHIPFHLGPRLWLDRCALGTKQGIIVSDYVSGSEKLSNCARDGRAVPIIASLFNTTIRAWQDCSKPVEKPLQDYLKDRMGDGIPEHRRSLIEGYEFLKKPTELQTLLKTMTSKPVMVGVVHGDLHALNVLVRGGDAIVIDFEKFGNDLPLLIDLASLEAGLFVEGFVGDCRNREDLLISIESLYELVELVDFHFIPCDPSDESAWFFDCVRQIRMQARQIELANGQYALTVAVELTKKACNKKTFNTPTEIEGQKLTREELRAIAYILAERILVKLSDTNVENNI